MAKSISHLFNKRRLRHLYVAKVMTTTEIAKIYNCNEVTIRNYLKKFGIKRRRDSPRYVCILKSLNKTQSAYLAGIIDGEGTITIAKSKISVGGITPMISVANTNPKIMEWLTLNIGGKVNAYDHKIKGWNIKYTWRINTVADITKIINQTLPYLTIKKRNAELVLDFCKWRLKLAQKSRKKPKIYLRKSKGYGFEKVNQIIYPHYADILKIKYQRGVKC